MHAETHLSQLLATIYVKFNLYFNYLIREIQWSNGITNNSEHAFDT